jgi:hypothetical protein
MQMSEVGHDFVLVQHNNNAGAARRVAIKHYAWLHALDMGGGLMLDARLRAYACAAARAPHTVYSSGATKLIGLVGGPSARQVESDSEELSSKDGR